MTVRRVTRRRTVEVIRTTLPISAELVAAMDREVRDGRATSRIELVEEAIERELKRRENEEIDRQIRESFADPESLAIDQEVMDAFASADREAWAALDEIDGGYDWGDLTP